MINAAVGTETTGYTTDHIPTTARGSKPDVVLPLVGVGKDAPHPQLLLRLTGAATCLQFRFVIAYHNLRCAFWSQILLSRYPACPVLPGYYLLEPRAFNIASFNGADRVEDPVKDELLS